MKLINMNNLAGLWIRCAKGSRRRKSSLGGTIGFFMVLSAVAVLGTSNLHPLDHFDAGETLGQGGQGLVEKVHLKSDPTQVYARKRIGKYDLTDDEKMNIDREINIGLGLDNSFVGKILNTCEDANNIYLLMNLYHGGDFEQYKKGRIISEHAARFYIACANEALIYLHGKDIIYRDLKPANLVFDQDGYLILIDFGLARVLAKSEKCTEGVGTHDSMPPEVNYTFMKDDFDKLSNTYNYAEGYNHAADNFNLGIMLYEMLTGKKPHPNGCSDYIKPDYTKGIGAQWWGKYEEYEHFLKEVDFPEENDISEDAKSLIKRLLDFNPQTRIGGNKIYGHEWFLGFDLPAFRARRMAAPWKPSPATKTVTPGQASTHEDPRTGWMDPGRPLPSISEVNDRVSRLTQTLQTALQVRQNQRNTASQLERRIRDSLNKRKSEMARLSRRGNAS